MLIQYLNPFPSNLGYTLEDASAGPIIYSVNGPVVDPWVRDLLQIRMPL